MSYVESKKKIDAIRQEYGCKGEVMHMPDEDDIWECAMCGYNAAGSDFNW